MAPKSGKTSQRCSYPAAATHHPFSKMRSAPYIFLLLSASSFFFLFLSRFVDALVVFFNFICTRSTWNTLCCHRQRRRWPLTPAKEHRILGARGRVRELCHRREVAEILIKPKTERLICTQTCILILTSGSLRAKSHQNRPPSRA